MAGEGLIQLAAGRAEWLDSVLVGWRASSGVTRAKWHSGCRTHGLDGLKTEPLHVFAGRLAAEMVQRLKMVKLPNLLQAYCHASCLSVFLWSTGHVETSTKLMRACTNLMLFKLLIFQVKFKIKCCLQIFGRFLPGNTWWSGGRGLLTQSGQEESIATGNVPKSQQKYLLLPQTAGSLNKSSIVSPKSQLENVKNCCQKHQKSLLSVL